MNKLITLAFFIFFTSCSTFLNEEYLTVKSNTEKTLIYLNKDKKRYPLGTSPLKMSYSQIFEKYSDLKKGDTLILEANKENYFPSKIILTNFATNSTNIELPLTLKKNIEAKEIDQIVKVLFKASKLVSEKNYTNALKEITKLKGQYGHISSIHELEGYIYYILKDFKNSLKSLNKAILYNADNVNAKVLKSKILKQ